MLLPGYDCYPVLSFVILRLVALVSEGPNKLSSYELVAKFMGDAWLQFQIHYYQTIILIFPTLLVADYS